MEDKHIEITTECGWWSCGDGCCSEYYEDIFVNGEYVGQVLAHEDPEGLGMVRCVLEHLGYTVTIN